MADETGCAEIGVSDWSVVVVSELDGVLIQIHAMLVLRFNDRDPERRLLIIKIGRAHV